MLRLGPPAPATFTILAANTPAVGDNGANAATTAFVRSTLPINVKAYGAKGDGTTDDTAAITAAENALTASGGVVYFPAGTYIVAGLTKQSNTAWVGESKTATVLKLKAGTTADLILGASFATLTGGSTSGGPRYWGVRNMTLDGNRANATGGYGIRVYGCTFYISDIIVRNCAGDGIYTEFGYPTEFAGPNEPVQGYISEFDIHNNGGFGLRILGPHDTMVSRGTVHASDASAEIYSGAGGAQFSDVHAYGQTNNIATSAAWKIYAVKNTLTNCVGEGGFGCQFLVAAYSCVMTGIEAYDGYNASGSAFYGIQIGDGTNYAGNCTVTAAWIQGCNSGAVRLLSDDGNNRIQATCDQNSGVLYVGSITAGTELDLKPSSRLASTGAATDSGRVLLSRHSFNALTLNDGAYNDVFNINTVAKRFELPNGGIFRGYSDAYATSTYSLNGASGLGAFTSLTTTAPAAGDSSALVPTTSFVSNATQGNVTIATTGGTTTLTAAQYSVPIQLVTGALTSNAILVVPNSGIFTVSNKTSGAFTLTVKTAAGTGYAVPQGVSSYLMADGTNVVGGRTDFNAIAVTNSTVNSTSVGATTPSTGAFTTLAATTPALGDSSTNAATTAFVANASKGVVTISTTGGTSTLTAIQASVPALLVTGALTANAIIVTPNTGNWAVINRTTGAFTVTVKTAAGTGVAVTQGYSDYFVADGTNVVMGDSDLAGAVITGGTITASTLGTSSVVQPSGTGVVPVPLVNILTATFHPYSYGIKADGVTNDTAGWTNLFADITTKGYGEIILPYGNSVITPGSLNIPSNTTIRGRGQQASGFIRPAASTGTLLRMNGTATAGVNHCVNNTLLDFAIRGTAQSGVLLQAIYSSHHSFENIRFDNSLDAGFQCVEFWDSEFSNCIWDTCGMNTSATAYTTTATPRLGSESIQILGGTAATGFGASGDSNNQISFSRCRIESFQAGAVAIQKLYGTNSGASNYGIRFSDTKIESRYFSGINFISMGDDTQATVFERSYIALDATNPTTGGNIGSMDLIYLGAGFGNQVRAVTFSIGQASAVRSCIAHNGGTFSKVEDIFVNGYGCTTAVLYIPGGSPVDYRNINYVNSQAGPLVAPTNYAPYGITPTVASGLTAAGTTQATALVLTAPLNIVTTVAAGNGVMLPNVPIGTEIVVRHRGATNALLVYPYTGTAIETAAANAAISLPVGGTARFIMDGAAHWSQGGQYSITGASIDSTSSVAVKPATGTGVSAVPLVNILTASLRPEFYGAKFDGTTNDTVAWQNMFADITAKGYGQIDMPAGKTVITPGSLNIPSNTVIRGRGQQTSSFVRASGAAGLLLRMNGTATGGANHSANCVLADFTINGIGLAGALLQMVYAGHHLLQNINFLGTLDAGVQCVELWDSVFSDCLWDNCGMNASATTSITSSSQVGSEAIQLLGGIAATGFGASADSNNQIAFTRCRMETFKAGAMVIHKSFGTNSGSANYAIRGTDFKIETGQFSGINFIYMSDDTQSVCFERCYLALLAAGTNATPVDLFYLGASFGNQLRYVTFSLAAAVQSCIRHYGIAGKVEDIFVNGVGCTTAVLYIPGGTPVDYRNINYVNNQTGPLVAPTNYAPYGITPTVASGLTAAGTTQATALALAAIENIVTTAASGSGVVLQAVAIGTQITVRNRGASALAVYPPTGGAIEALATNAAYSLATGATARFTPNTSTHWYQG